MRPLVCTLAGTALLACCQSPGPAAGVARFDDLGTYRRPVTTSSPQAQRWFDQGLALTYAFNHYEAIRAFEAATEADPHCAMAWWGIAYAHGPNINAPAMSPQASEAAHAALQRALACREQATPVERALIDALSERYQLPAPEDRAELDRAYADAMRSVWERFPQDADAGALFAEALLDLRPWDQWTKEGLAQPGTSEVIATLEQMLAAHPQHPGALHFWIHTIEASPDPARALFAADRLRMLVPDAGHLVHMPAHIYVRTGRYADAVSANARAVAVDRRYFAQAGHGKFYDFYFAHNLHFLAYAAMLDGRREIALEAARAIPREVVPPADPFAKVLMDGVMGTDLHVLVRFGRFDDVLAAPEPPQGWPVWHAFWRYARALSCSGTGRIEQAEQERAAFETERAALPAGALVVVNTASDVFRVASLMLEGELLFRRGQQDEAFAKLREAVTHEEALKYDEPPGWLQPVRHALGALLLEAGRHAEAETVYREDLARHPHNGWALHGLAECLRARGASDEAAAATAAFQDAWARADTVIEASCFCRRTE